MMFIEIKYIGIKEKWRNNERHLGVITLDLLKSIPLSLLPSTTLVLSFWIFIIFLSWLKHKLHEGRQFIFHIRCP